MILIKYDLGQLIAFVGQVMAYMLAIILIIQILRALYGGTWQIEEVILALVIFNLTITFGIGGYLIHLNNNLNNKISNVNAKVEGHLGWHKGKI